MSQLKKPRYERTYVTVTSTTDSTGFIHPEKVIWDDHRAYKIDEVKDFRPAHTVGNLPGDCFTVVIRGQIRLLFYERIDAAFKSRYGRWFVLTQVN